MSVTRFTLWRTEDADGAGVNESNCEIELIEMKIQGEPLMVSRFKNASCLQVPFSQLTQSLLNGTTHVSGNAWWQKPGSPAGYLYPHRLDDLCVVVKRRRRVQQSILQSFSADTWTATGATLAAFAGALRLIGRRNVFLEVVDAFINGGFVARESDRRANLLLLLLSAFGLVMVSAFTGRFMGFLAVLGEPHQMQTLVEVARHASRVYGLEYIPPLLKDVEKNDVVWKLVAKLQTTKAEEAKATMLRDFSSEETSNAYIISMGQARVFLEGNLWDASSGTTLGYQHYFTLDKYCSNVHISPLCKFMIPTFNSTTHFNPRFKLNNSLDLINKIKDIDVPPMQNSKELLIVLSTDLCKSGALLSSV
ncbi:Protein of unknown function [Gryllus bimaculatus]|nr:Protein of unknown function [Gryllus bimaculatus]